MPLWLDQPDCKVFHGSALEELRNFEDNTFHCCVTSPPYWGLRDYKSPPQIWGGNPACEHEWGSQIPGSNRGGSGTPTDKNGRGENYGKNAARGQWCQSCNAWLGSFGLEPTPELYIEHAISIFREVRRVLRNDGTLWLNIGDSYAHNGGTPGGGNRDLIHLEGTQSRMTKIPEGCGLKEKDLVGIPWMLAFALRNDGWYLRQEIIWNKPNAMPESVTDRCTKSHEQIFLLTKSANYYFDQEAIKEPAITAGQIVTLGERSFAKRQADGAGVKPSGNGNASHYTVKAMRNKRSVWEVNTQPFPEAHFAVFPSQLIKPCILAGTSEKGCCPKCGAPWIRVTQKGELSGESKLQKDARPAADIRNTSKTSLLRTNGRTFRERHTVGWNPTCSCKPPLDRLLLVGEDRNLLPPHLPNKCLVLDPFAGSGTALATAMSLGRNATGIELQSDYLSMIQRRIKKTALVTLMS